MSPALSRIAALGLLAIMLSAAWLYGAEPTIRAYAADRADVAQAAERLARYRSIDSSFEDLQSELQRVSRNLDRASLVINAATPALASAALQERVRSAISEAGGEQRSVQVIPSEDLDPFVQVGVRVTATTPMTRLIDLLSGLESDEPFIAVDDIVVRTAATRRRNAAENDDPMLTVSLRLFAYVDVQPDE